MDKLNLSKRNIIIVLSGFLIILVLGVLFMPIQPSISEVKEKCTLELHRFPDQVLLAKLIKAEALGESFEDKLYVGSVVINRVHSKDFPGRLDSVIFEPGQFQSIKSPLFKFDKGLDSLSFAEQECFVAAGNILLHGSILEKGFLYFHRRDINSDWSKLLKLNSEKIITTKNHIYYDRGY